MNSVAWPETLHKPVSLPCRTACSLTVLLSFSSKRDEQSAGCISSQKTGTLESGFIIPVNTRMNFANMTSAHFIFIPTVLFVGVCIGWVLGSRAARDAYAMELRKRESRLRGQGSGGSTGSRPTQPESR